MATDHDLMDGSVAPLDAHRRWEDTQRASASAVSRQEVWLARSGEEHALASLKT